MSEIVTRTIRACGCALLLLSISSSLRAQEAATSTPVRISIPTEGVEALQGVATPTATRTPTPSVVVLEAKADAGPVNVRADADIEADRLGTIQAGEYYPVLGRRYRWLQFQFPSAPQGRAWVFEELVTLSGDESAIPDLLLATSEAPVQTQVNATLTQAALLRTPGAVLTLTAGARILPFPGQGSEPGGADPAAEGRTSLLPTYTYPPQLAAATATPEESQDDTTLVAASATLPPGQERIPPIAPIALLAAGGLLGLMLNSLRRR